MILTSLKQRQLILFIILLTLFLISCMWKLVDITSGNTKCLDKLIMLERGVENMKTKKETIYPAKEENEILVLLWQWPSIYRFPLDNCHKDYGITGCKLSYDMSLYSAADVVVIHFPTIMHNINLLPKQPRPHFQRWVWFNREPPLIIKNLDRLDNLINMTMTFRLDSDIFCPYGRLEILKEPQNFTIPTKSKLVSWIVSKWYPGVRRIAYYEELKKHIPIDVYGAKHMKLSRDETLSTISQYKFYLAFENSNYKDYITEKLWSNSFESGAVPVVLGTTRKNYEVFVPRDAFIHVDDFPSPKELAAYLLELDKDDVKYRKYFNWRSKYRVKYGNVPSYMYCKVCRKIRESPRYRVIHSLRKWYLEDV